MKKSEDSLYPPDWIKVAQKDWQRIPYQQSKHRSCDCYTTRIYLLPINSDEARRKMLSQILPPKQWLKC